MEIYFIEKDVSNSTTRTKEIRIEKKKTTQGPEERMICIVSGGQSCVELWRHIRSFDYVDAPYLYFLFSIFYICLSTSKWYRHLCSFLYLLITISKISTLLLFIRPRLGLFWSAILYTSVVWYRLLSLSPNKSIPKIRTSQTILSLTNFIKKE